MIVVAETDTNERALVEAARRGDRASFGVLVDRHRDLLHALCQRALGDPTLAEDAVQEAVLRAFLSLDRLREPERFGPWLCGIGLNVSRQLMRERAASPWSWEALSGGRQIPEPPRPTLDPVLHAELREMTARVRRAIGGLPPGQRAATLLFYLQGLSYAEAAATLGIAVSALKARLHKARRTLRAQLHDLWKEDIMGTQTNDQLVEARVLDMRRPRLEGDAPAQHIVVLETTDGAHRLPIWVGRAEAEAMALQFTRTQTARPLTFTFFAELLTGLGHPLREVRINRLADGVFYATAVLETSRGVRLVDARPSDALNLALATGAPIRVDPAVVALAGSSDVDSRTPGQGTADARALAGERLAEWEQARAATESQQT